MDNAGYVFVLEKMAECLRKAGTAFRMQAIGKMQNQDGLYVDFERRSVNITLLHSLFLHVASFT